jgi:hypothetical protein
MPQETALFRNTWNGYFWKVKGALSKSSLGGGGMFWTRKTEILEMVKITNEKVHKLCCSVNNIVIIQLRE